MAKSKDKSEPVEVDPELEELFPRVPEDLRKRLIEYIEDYKKSREKKPN